MGHRPNKASWYAVTWRSLDKLPGYDVGTIEGFKRGAYQQNIPLKNASLRPPAGTELMLIVPPAGNHLDMPSDADKREQGIYRRLTARPTNLFTNLIH